MGKKQASEVCVWGVERAVGGKDKIKCYLFMKMTYFMLIKIKEPVQISPFQEFLLTPPESLVSTFLVFPSVL